MREFYIIRAKESVFRDKKGTEGFIKFSRTVHANHPRSIISPYYFCIPLRVKKTIA